MAIPFETIVQAYIKTRDEIKEKEAAHKEELKVLNELQQKREDYLYLQLAEQKLKNVKTEFGTIYKTRKESVTVKDWGAFISWVKENDRYEFLNAAANKTMVLDAMGAERDQAPPPGVGYNATATVNIRKN